MSVYKDILGIMSQYFKVGGPGGPRIKNASGVVELRNTGDSAYAVARAAVIAASGGANDVVPLQSLQGRAPNIEFSFDGASPPAAGTNTGKFGFCHTTGGGYTAGRVYYDDGASLVLLPTEVARTLTTSAAVTGTISLIANGVYALEGGSWVLKGDGTGATTGVVRYVELAFDFGDVGNIDSTTSIADGARIIDVRCIVETAFDNTPTIAVSINGSSPLTVMTSGENDPTVIGEYQKADTGLVGATQAGVVRVALGGTPTVGAGRVLVGYVTPLA